MRNDLLHAHAEDLQDTGTRLYGCRVVEDPYISSVKRELPWHHLRIELGKINGPAVTETAVQVARAATQFELVDGLAVRGPLGDVLTLEKRPHDNRWNLVSEDGPSTWGIEASDVHTLVQPLKEEAIQ